MLDGFHVVVAATFWIKIVARRTSRGLRYSLTLHDMDGRRIMGIDNAHGHPHRHRGDVILPYVFRDAASLLDDFWADVDRMLEQRGISS